MARLLSVWSFQIFLQIPLHNVRFHDPLWQDHHLYGFLKLSDTWHYDSNLQIHDLSWQDYNPYGKTIICKARLSLYGKTKICKAKFSSAWQDSLYTVQSFQISSHITLDANVQFHDLSLKDSCHDSFIQNLSDIYECHECQVTILLLRYYEK